MAGLPVHVHHELGLSNAVESPPQIGQRRAHLELKSSVLGTVLVHGDAMEFMIDELVCKRDHAVVVVRAVIFKPPSLHCLGGPLRVGG